MQHPHTRQGGFTLLELLVVLLIIGLLAGYVGPKYFAQISKSNTTVAKSQIEAFDKAVDQYHVDTSHYPAQLDDLVTQPPNEPKWTGPYLKKAIPMDPWGRKYIYKLPGDPKLGHDYEIVSLGKDGAEGGSGEDADVTSY